MTEENKIRDAADAIKGIVEAVPVYQDAIQPAAKEVGTALQTVAKTLHILLAPVSALVWGYEKIKDFVGDRVAQKLKDVPVEELQQPAPNIAGPALEALRYTGYQDELREMYANLLATSIDGVTAKQAHPAFVEIIKQMSPDEAKMLKVLSLLHTMPMVDVRSEEKESSAGRWAVRNFTLLPHQSRCANLDLGPNYLDNLSRLGLVELRENYTLSAIDGADQYLPLIESPEIASRLDAINSVENRKAKVIKGAVMLTQLGIQFCNSCIVENTHTRARL